MGCPWWVKILAYVLPQIDLLGDFVLVHSGNELLSFQHVYQRAILKFLETIAEIKINL